MSDKTNNTVKKKGKGKKIALVVLGLIVVVAVAAGAFLALNPTWASHIKAAFIFATSSSDDIEQNLGKIENDRIEAVQSSGYALSAQAEKALTAGQITSQQFEQILLGKLTLEDALEQTSGEQAPPGTDSGTDDTKTDIPEKSDESDVSDNPSAVVTDNNVDVSGGKDEGKDNANVKDNPSEQKPKPDDKQEDKTDNLQLMPTEQQNPSSADNNNPQQNQTAQSSAADEKIASLITKMYVLKSNYIGQIEGVVGSMISEFTALPAENRTTSAKQTIATRYLSKINAMEAQCDAQVNSIVTELRQVLKANGRDMSLADSIISTYNAEKENTKAYYISRYGD